MKTLIAIILFACQFTYAAKRSCIDTLSLGDIHESQAQYEMYSDPDASFLFFNANESTITNLLLKLEPKEEYVIRLRHLHEMTYKEIGVQMGLSTERIRQTDLKALRKLKHAYFSSLNTIRSNSFKAAVKGENLSPAKTAQLNRIAKGEASRAQQNKKTVDKNKYLAKTIRKYKERLANTKDDHIDNLLMLKAEQEIQLARVKKTHERELKALGINDPKALYELKVEQDRAIAHLIKYQKNAYQKKEMQDKKFYESLKDFQEKEIERIKDPSFEIPAFNHPGIIML